MTLLILGLALWWAAHLWKRVSPETRAKAGDPGKGIVALLVVASIVLMVLGYRAWDSAVYWGRAGWSVGLNNLLMVAAFYIYSTGAPGPGKPRAWLGRRLRHPQLIGFSVWAVAHLLVNGDVASFVLFGGLLVWALFEIVMINRSELDWTPAPSGGPRKELSPVIATAVLLVVVMLIHNWLGVRPWG